MRKARLGSAALVLMATALLAGGAGAQDFEPGVVQDPRAGLAIYDFHFQGPARGQLFLFDTLLLVPSPCDQLLTLPFLSLGTPGAFMCPIQPNGFFQCGPFASQCPPGEKVCLDGFQGQLQGTNRVQGQYAGFCELDGVVQPFLQPFDGVATGCLPDPSTLCLNSGRFEVSAQFRTSSEEQPRPAMALPQTSPDSGEFWFFSPDNTEISIKVIDGCAFFDHFWVFFAATTNVELEITVTDTQSGLTNQYFNPLGQAAEPIQDTQAFATCP